jgi:hypothetical protein
MPTPDAPPPVVGELEELPEGVTVEAVGETGVDATATAGPTPGPETVEAGTEPGAGE